MLMFFSGGHVWDYEQIYPEDDYMEEMSDGARVWRVYNGEAEIKDVEMIEGWKTALNTLLIFVSKSFPSMSIALRLHRLVFSRQ
jgi:hypothetical protein